MTNHHKRTTPIDALVADIVSKFDDDLRDDFEERAGIIEYDGQIDRAHAECLALLDVLRRHPSVLTGVVVLEVELEGATQWLLTTDIAFARQMLKDMDCAEMAVLEPSEVIDTQYGGVSMLSTIG